MVLLENKTPSKLSDALLSELEHFWEISMREKEKWNLSRGGKMWSKSLCVRHGTREHTVKENYLFKEKQEEDTHSCSSG